MKTEVLRLEFGIKMEELLERETIKKTKKTYIEQTFTKQESKQESLKKNIRKEKRH